ncbi:alpha/beta hydrolase [Pseudoalteromonas sp.]|uniref:alpha/beta hydrolase n=1 Tax=Pseudoalteromonas sp. TaxID=53249 RepID=UPI0030036713
MSLNGILLAFVLLITSSFAISQTDCVTQLTDLKYIMQSKQQGLLRFEKNKPTTSFAYQTSQTYSDYLSYAYQHILDANPRALMPCPIQTATHQLLVKQQQRPSAPNIVDLIAPFELRQNNTHKAVLLIHGLTDSPFTFHDLANVYFAQGYNVRTLLLPGHSTAADALSNVTTEQWQQAVDYAIARTSKDFDQVILGGYSTGATLLINSLTLNPVSPKVTALMLFSPATEPHNKNGWLAKWINRIPFVNWLDKDADIDFAKYESFPFNAAAAADDAMSNITLHKLMQRPLPNLAIFSVMSDIDTTIDTRASLQLLSTLHDVTARPANRLDTLIYYGDKNTINSDFPADYTVINPQCQISSCKNIHGISHIAVINSPNNPHYGAQGYYRNCGSYLDNDALYANCKTTKKPNIGERTAANVAAFPTFQRLTYNPYFDQQADYIKQFIQQVEGLQGNQE